MSGKIDTAAHGQIASIPRIARLVTFVLPLVLALLLLGAKAAQAAPALPGIVPLALEELEGEEEGFEGELELEACESAEEEFEEGTLGEAAVEVACEEGEDEGRKKAAGSNAVAPEECLLRSAHTSAVASAQGHSLKLTVGYTAYEPVGATVEIRKGATRIGAVHRQLGRSGVLRIVKNLGQDSAPKRAVVRIGIPHSPRYCGKYRTEKVHVRQTTR